MSFQETLDDADRYRKYIQSGLSEQDYLQSLPVQERERLTAYLASLGNAVKEKLLSLIPAKPAPVAGSQDRMGRIGKTQSSETLD